MPPPPITNGPRAPVRRLGGLNNRQPGQFTPLPKPVQRVSNCCDNPVFETHDASKICVNCGTQISEQNIVAEVTFGETSTGAATVQGGYVGENARHAKNLGAAASRRIGGQYQSREQTEQNGRRELRQLCPQLRVGPNVEEVAFNLWRLAATQNFIQGRRTSEVAGVCLYAACRRDKHNTVLLMDISDALQVNVFRLGDIFKELNKTLYLEVHSQIQPVVDVEPLLFKYATELEFGDKTRQVAEDAARIIKRMKRDWMVTGRHPAGLCGACIILAARMNNFRRTVREVVYIVKVADMTITNRLAEFKRTRSSTMSVQDFRSKALRVKHQHDPPSINAAAERKKKLENVLLKREARKSARSSLAPSDTSSRQSSVAAATPGPDTSSHGDDTTTADQPNKGRRISHGSSPCSTPPQARIDSEGFAIPAIPTGYGLDPALRDPILQVQDALRADQFERADTDDTSENQSDPPSRKKTQKRAKNKPVPLTDADFAQENELEGEIEEFLRDDNCVSSRDDAEREKLEARAKAVAEQERFALLASERERLAAQGRQQSVVSDSVEIGQDEFADDPEVLNALLSDDQVKVKEKIWVAHNEDWLRAQQAKQLKRALDEAEGRTTEKRTGPRKKRSRMGDGTVLTEGGTPVASPVDAATRMLDKRAPKNWSKSIDYAALNRIMGGPTGATTPADSRAASTVTTPAPASRATTPTLSRSAERSAWSASSSKASTLPAPPDVQHAIVQGVVEAHDMAQARVDRVGDAVEAERARDTDAGAGPQISENEDDDEDDVDDDDDDDHSIGGAWDDHDEDAEFNAAQDDITGNFEHDDDEDYR